MIRFITDAKTKNKNFILINKISSNFFIKQTISSNYTKVKFKVESFDEVAKSAKLCVA